MEQQGRKGENEREREDIHTHKIKQNAPKWAPWLWRVTCSSRAVKVRRSAETSNSSFLRNKSVAGQASTQPSATRSWRESACK